MTSRPSRLRNRAVGLSSRARVTSTWDSWSVLSRRDLKLTSRAGGREERAASDGMTEKRCPLGCGLVVPLEELKTHVEELCLKRTIPCHLCGADLWAEEVVEHETSTCPARQVLCSLGCGVSLRASQEPLHLNEECELRSVRCECGSEVPFREKSFHDSVLCDLRLALCPQGCGEKLPPSTMEEHTLKKCRNKHLHYERTTEYTVCEFIHIMVGLCACPLGCDQVMKVKDVVAHVGYFCGRRFHQNSLVTFRRAPAY